MNDLIARLVHFEEHQRQAGEQYGSEVLHVAKLEIQKLTDEIRQKDDAAEMLWVVLANVSGGDWEKQTPEWQEAAARWRDNYFDKFCASDRRECPKCSGTAPEHEAGCTGHFQTTAATRRDSWWCDGCQMTHHDGETCAAESGQKS